MSTEAIIANYLWGRILMDYNLNCVTVDGVVVEGSFVFGEGVFFNLRLVFVL